MTHQPPFSVADAPYLPPFHSKSEHVLLTHPLLWLFWFSKDLRRKHNQTLVTLWLVFRLSQLHPKGLHSSAWILSSLGVVPTYISVPLHMSSLCYFHGQRSARKSLLPSSFPWLSLEIRLLIPLWASDIFLAKSNTWDFPNYFLIICVHCSPLHCYIHSWKKVVVLCHCALGKSGSRVL